MSEVILAEHMKWTYQELASQPVWFISLLRLKLKLDSDYTDKQNKKAKQKPHGKR